MGARLLDDHPSTLPLYPILGPVVGTLGALRLRLLGSGDLHLDGVILFKINTEGCAGGDEEGAGHLRLHALIVAAPIGGCKLFAHLF